MSNDKDIHALETIDELVNYNNYIYRKITKDIKSGENLDFGCGFGNFIKFANSKKLNFIGYEINPTAKQNLVKKEIPFLNNLEKGYKYDNIVSINVLEHIEKDNEIFEQFNTMLKTKGKLILYLPHSMRLWTDLDELANHKRRYTKTELVSKLDIAGFHVEKVEYVDFIGAVVLFIFKLIKITPSYNKNRLIFYDKTIFKFFKYIDLATKYFFGKNILVIASLK
tara:strand:- start:94 stop:765 length:672 start_codon:yes stop_codon:yes gene_type:complete